MLDHQPTHRLMLVFLIVPLGEMLDQLITGLHPELHLFEWTACFSGAMLGQVAFRPDGYSGWRMLAGFCIGYLAGLHGGPDWATWAGWKNADLGRLCVAFMADLLVRIVDYVVRHPVATADFLVRYGEKLVGLLGGDAFDKLLTRFDAWRNKKKSS